MADIKISQLSAMSVVNDANVLPIVANDVTMKVSAQKLKEYTIGTTDNTDIGANVSAQIETLKNNIAKLNAFANLKGKTIAVFGSSNEVDGWSGGSNWVTLMANMLQGYATVVNKSISGITVIDSITNFINDADKADYDIILFTSTRNLFKAQNQSDIFGNNYAPFFGTLYTKINSLQDYITHDQEVYFASSLPFTDCFKQIPMCIYDGVVKRACIQNGFKMLDMHSWLGIPDSAANDYTSDGSHYTSEAMPILAKKCISVLAKGGETFENYACVIKGNDVLNWSGFLSITSGVTLVSTTDTWIYADMNFDNACRLVLKNESGSEIAANTNVVSITEKSILSYPSYTHSYCFTNFGTDLDIRNRTNAIQVLNSIPNNNNFSLYRKAGDSLRYAT